MIELIEKFKSAANKYVEKIDKEILIFDDIINTLSSIIPNSFVSIIIFDRIRMCDNSIHFKLSKLSIGDWTILKYSNGSLTDDKYVRLQFVRFFKENEHKIINSIDEFYKNNNCY